MKTKPAVLALLVLAAFSTSAMSQAPKDHLLDRLTGNWTLKGTIAGRETTHDIESEWVLNHEYLRFHEISREKNIQGQPAYEAIVMIEWDESSNEYKCLWLDSTAGGGLSAPIAQGTRGNDEIVFIFTDKEKKRTTDIATIRRSMRRACLELRRPFCRWRPWRSCACFRILKRSMGAAPAA